MALAKLASVLILAMVSTPAVALEPTRSLSRARFSASVAAVPSVAPMAAYCAAVGLLAVSASAKLPLASAKMAVYALTMACTSAVVSAAVRSLALPKVVSEPTWWSIASLMALTLLVVTPATPAST